MAVKAKILESIDRGETKECIVSIYCDTKEDITDDIRPDGIPNNYHIGLGSYTVTANGEVAFRKSDDTWSWTDESNE